MSSVVKNLLKWACFFTESGSAVRKRDTLGDQKPRWGNDLKFLRERYNSGEMKPTDRQIGWVHS